MNRPGKRTRRKVPLQAGQPLKFTVLETLDQNKEEFEFLQAQYHRWRCCIQPLMETDPAGGASKTELPELVAPEEVGGRVYNAVGKDDGACDDVDAFQVLDEEAPVHTNPHHEEDAGVQIDMEDIAASDAEEGEVFMMERVHEKIMCGDICTHVVKTEEEAAKRGAFFLLRKTMTEARPPRSHAGGTLTEEIDWEKEREPD
ncbi:hypothetical protein JZ751_014087 [Albula glossodonta]|uniref:Uncharacterized protein n=1 Tax=Albula glossodonta TaxID=121402 RepID=A0A8T2NRY8_9TELE|nr:hypothetical protein JZ751_014087 [Albula glossodonta]